FGGHEYPRLAHVGDRTGLEMIRTLQQEVVALQQEDAVTHGDPEAMVKVFAETTITRLISGGGRIAGAVGYVRDSGGFGLFAATAACCATPRASGSCSATCPTCSGTSTRRPRTRPTAGTTTRTTTGGRLSCCPATRWPGRSTRR